jgi:hypothetical protein
MAKKDEDILETPIEPTAGTVAQPAEFPVGLEEFCAAHSREYRRVQLLGAFHGSERRAGNVKDTPTNYRKRLQAFADKPA